ncbi:MAG: hypothetical protein DMF74_13935 [Acidobacteria bacterium]|nr:MAG: hypothetical protein DMF74_13935 [Acidobacteriota bacterium]
MMRQPRSREELLASGAELYEALADYYFRSNHRWSAKGKAIPRILKRADADLCLRFCNSFDELFSHGESEKVIALVGELLETNGGFLFDGHRLEAPGDHRKPIADTHRISERFVVPQRE